MSEQIINEENFIVNQPKLLGAIDKILIKRSIAKRVSDIQPLTGPVGIISGAQWDRINNKLSIAKKDIEATTKKIRTEFTIEALQDLEAIYKEDFYDILAHYLIDEMSYLIDEEFILMIKARAHQKQSLVFGGDYDEDMFAIGQSIAISVTKGLADLPISDNRSPAGWAIVSSNIGSILDLTTNVSQNVEGSGELNIDDSPSYIGKLGGVDYYIDYTHPNDGVDSVVFGIKGNGYSKGSTIFSPYRQDWIDTVDPETGENIYFLLERSSSAINPLDEKYYDNGNGTSAFLGKFDVDLSGLAIMQ